MKKVITILLSILLVTAMLLSFVSATAKIQTLTKEDMFVSCYVKFTVKDEYAGADKTYSASDFPELPVLTLDMYRGDTVYGTIVYDRNSRLTVEEAMEKLAQNPMIESVGVGEKGFVGVGGVPGCRGDVDEDGALNAKDIALMMKLMLGLELPFELINGISVADVNGDGWINSKDIIQVMKWVLED